MWSHQSMSSDELFWHDPSKRYKNPGFKIQDKGSKKLIMALPLSDIQTGVLIMSACYLILFYEYELKMTYPCSCSSSREGGTPSIFVCGCASRPPSRLGRFLPLKFWFEHGLPWRIPVVSWYTGVAPLAVTPTCSTWIVCHGTLRTTCTWFQK